jgi:hypothetical protein
MAFRRAVVATVAATLGLVGACVATSPSTAEAQRTITMVRPVVRRLAIASIA